MSDRRLTAVRRDRDLYLILAVVAAGASSSALGRGPSVLPVMFASPLVLFLPGYALVEALRPPQLDLVQRLVTSIGASLAVVILIGIALNWLPGGIDRASELSSLSGITVLGVAVAWARRRRLRHAKPAGRVGQIRLGVTPGLLLACLAAIALAASGLWIARRAALHQQRIDSPTQLWLLPDSSGTRSVRVGVKNADGGGVTYRLRVTDGSAIVKEWRSIVLPAGASWTASVKLPADSVHDRVEATLYRLGSRSPYRQVAEAERR